MTQLADLPEETLVQIAGAVLDTTLAPDPRTRQEHDAGQATWRAGVFGSWMLLGRRFAQAGRQVLYIDWRFTCASEVRDMLLVVGWHAEILRYFRIVGLDLPLAGADADARGDGVDAIVELLGAFGRLDSLAITSATQAFGAEADIGAARVLRTASPVWSHLRQLGLRADVLRALDVEAGVLLAALESTPNMEALTMQSVWWRGAVDRRTGDVDRIARRFRHLELIVCALSAAVTPISRLVGVETEWLNLWGMSLVDQRAVLSSFIGHPDVVAALSPRTRWLVGNCAQADRAVNVDDARAVVDGIVGMCWLSAGALIIAYPARATSLRLSRFEEIVFVEQVAAHLTNSASGRFLTRLIVPYSARHNELDHICGERGIEVTYEGCARQTAQRLTPTAGGFLVSDLALTRIGSTRPTLRTTAVCGTSSCSDAQLSIL